MPLSPVHHASLSVADLDRSVAFYRDALGFRTTMEAPVDTAYCTDYLHMAPGTSGRMVIMQADERTIGELELIQWTPSLDEPRSAPGPRSPGIWMLAFEIVGETLHDTCVRLADLGIPVWADITPVELDGYPTFHAAMIQDPDGILLELIQLPTRDDIRRFRAEAAARR